MSEAKRFSLLRFSTGKLSSLRLVSIVASRKNTDTKKMRENTTAKYKSQTARLTEMANTQFLVNNFVVKNEFSTGAKFDSSTRNEMNQQMMKYFLGRFECFRFTLLTDVFQSFVCAWRRSVYVLSNVGKRRGVTKWLP